MPLKKGTGSEQDAISLLEFHCSRGACPLFQHLQNLNDWKQNKEQPLITQLYELSILAQQTYSSAYRAGQIFGYIFLIVLAIAVLKKILS
jgi:hypothetical protein